MENEMITHNNGNAGVNHGNGVLSGRGLPRRKAGVDERAAMAAAYAVGELKLRPSINQLAAMFNVPRARVVTAIKARKANDGTMA